MFKDTKEYLAEQPDLLAFLAEIPEIKEFVKKKQETEYVCNIIKKIPNDLLEVFWLSESFNSPAEQNLKTWCLDNLEPAEIHYVFRDLKIQFGCII